MSEKFFTPRSPIVDVPDGKDSQILVEQLDTLSNKERENAEYFAEFKKLIETNAIEVKLILSPPRTGSTLMESSFAQNVMIDLQIHEPFIDQRKSVSTEAYKKIVLASEEAESSPDHPTQFLIKEMAHWLMLNGEHQRFLSLIEKPVIVLIRNPLLSTESRIKKVLETLYLREKGAVHETLLSYYSRKSDGKNWNEVMAIYTSEQSIPENEEISELNKELYETLTSQRLLLDYYALTKGYGSWAEMIQLAFDNRDYGSFEEILTDERIFSMEDGGWEATEKLVAYMNANAKQSVIVDSSDFRLEPEQIVPRLCEVWDVPFSEGMISWGSNSKKLSTDQTRPHQTIWYDRLQNSTGIEPPNEFCPIPSDFPASIAEHLLAVDLPIYARLLANTSRIASGNDVTRQEVVVPVNKRSYKRLRDMGLLPDSMSLTEREEGDIEVLDTLDKQGALSGEESQNLITGDLPKISLKIQDIDPIYAYLSDPDILNNSEFRTTNHRYLDTIAKIEAFKEIR